MLTKRMNMILDDAKERLDRFYKVYGENKEKLKTDDPEIPVPEDKPFFKDGPVKNPVVIKKIEPLIKTEEESKNKRRSKNCTTRLRQNFKLDHAISPSGEKIIFSNLNASGIINKIFELTGKEIKISLKSKKNIIRHAISILSEHGFTGFETMT